MIKAGLIILILISAFLLWQASHAHAIFLGGIAAGDSVQLPAGGATGAGSPPAGSSAILLGIP